MTPMTPTELNALAEKVEALDGPSREVDCLSWCMANSITPEWQGNCLVAGKEGVIGYIDPGVLQRNFSTNRSDRGPGSIPAYTASLDAAMTLVPEGHTVQLSDWDHELLRKKGPWQAIVLPLGARGAMQQFTFSNRCDHAATPALALCSAALRARAASLLTEEGA